MRKKSLLSAFHIKTSSCIHQLNSHARYIVIFDQWNRNYYKKINSFESEVFATMYNRDIDFAKLEIIKIVKIFENLSLYFLIRFVFFSFAFSLWLRFVLVVVELFWVEMSWLYIWLSHWLYIWFESDWVEIEKSNWDRCWKYEMKNESNSLMIKRRRTRIFVVILNETTRCWKCKRDAWNLMWHIFQRCCENNFRCLKINSR